MTIADDLYLAADERARGPSGGPAGEEGRAAAEHDPELCVEAARVEGTGPLYPSYTLPSSLSLLAC